MVEHSIRSESRNPSRRRFIGLSGMTLIGLALNATCKVMCNSAAETPPPPPNAISLSYPADTVRVAFFGGSTTRCPDPNNYPEQIAGNFHWFPLTRGNLEIINTSRSGESVIQIARRMPEYLNQNIDVAVVSEPWNFTLQRNAHKLGEEQTMLGSGRSKLLPWLPYAVPLSELIKYGTFAKDRKKLQAVDISEQLPEYITYIDRIRELCDQHETRLVLGLHPDSWDPVADANIGDFIHVESGNGGGHASILYPTHRYKFKRAINEKLREYAATHNIPTIDWESEFLRFPLEERKSYFMQNDGKMDNAHFNENGLLKWRVLLARFLKKLLLIPLQKENTYNTLFKYLPEI